MPTERQLSVIWESEMEFPETRPDFVPTGMPPNRNFSGKVIGHIKYDQVNKDLKIVINETDEDKKA